MLINKSVCSNNTLFGQKIYFQKYQKEHRDIFYEVKKGRKFYLEMVK